MTTPRRKNRVRPVGRLGGALAIVFVTVLPAARADVTPEDVRLSIKRGTEYLLREQTDGHWNEWPNQPGGVTALVTLALLSSGVPSDDPKMAAALKYLRGFTEPQQTYATALRTMALAAGDPDRDRLLIEKNVRFLEQSQSTSGRDAGGWDYGRGPGSTDESNTQFAILALHEASRVGVAVQEDTWKRARTYWLTRQNADGGWGYRRQGSSGSMTCAGVASLTILRNHLPEEGTAIRGETVDCCSNNLSKLEFALARGQAWLDRPSFTVSANLAGPNATYLYYLYALERVGRMTGRRFYNGIDWYRAGAEILVHHSQDKITGAWFGVPPLGEDQPHIASSLALLFLSKGRRPVVMAKLRHGVAPIDRRRPVVQNTDEDWDRHPLGLARLASAIERSWKRDLSWQTIDASAATLEDLLETPILLISGRDGLNLGPAGEKKLAQFVEQGGFLLIEATGGDACRSEAYDADVRAMLARVFPASELRVLPPDHGVWFAEQKLIPDPSVPVLGIEACCRTSVIYVPANLSCYWSLDEEGATGLRVGRPWDQVAYRVNLGKNIVAYATNRELPEKLRPKITLTDDGGAERGRGTLSVLKLAHEGGADDARQALPNLQRFARRELGLRVEITNRVIDPRQETLFDHPITFMHGRSRFTWSAAQRDALRKYLERGGFVLADAICGSPEFAAAFRAELTAALPGATWERLPADHPLLTTAFGGYDCRQAEVREPGVREESGVIRPRTVRQVPTLEAIVLDDRVAVVFSPLDISCALEQGSSPDCRGYSKDDAARLAMNILLYSLQQ